MRSQTFRLSFLVLVLALTLSTGCKKGTTSDSKKKKKNEKRESDVFERKDAIANAAMGKVKAQLGRPKGRRRNVGIRTATKSPKVSPIPIRTRAT